MLVKRVLVAVDFSSCSRVALAIADDLAIRYGARLSVMHVVPAELLLHADAPFAGRGSEEAIIEARKTLDQWVRTAVTPDDRRDVRVVFGAVNDVLIEASRRVDVLVLGTHGRHGLERLVMGSVAENMSRNAHCSVLIARPPQQQAA